MTECGLVAHAVPAHLEQLVLLAFPAHVEHHVRVGDRFVECRGVDRDPLLLVTAAPFGGIPQFLLLPKVGRQHRYPLPTGADTGAQHRGQHRTAPQQQHPCSAVAVEPPLGRTQRATNEGDLVGVAALLGFGESVGSIRPGVGDQVVPVQQIDQFFHCRALVRRQRGGQLGELVVAGQVGEQSFQPGVGLRTGNGARAAVAVQVDTL
ncbi:hypothetical protein FHX42_003801 [Saccharopolyspora lacisalsi]|uniref:Uncharacterized protein n=1 Tax=Halosaccharopolyspora lacisalsi TaxID=1000566 RepID=A0A839E3S3_9PSEU|nr:hypothetical protein [Halosaccharopolyspora lacisalsi]MBA8826425.1 hypothetical protein [Halosaccharopolyspora lacisalsi]